MPAPKKNRVRSHAKPRVRSQKIAKPKVRAARDAAIANREWLTIALQSIGDGVITTDTEGRITLFNTVAEELTGWRAREAIGKSLLDVFRIVHSKTRAPAEDPVRQVLAHGRTTGLKADTALVARDGTECIVSSSVAPIRTRTNRIAGVVLVFRDITRLRQAEEALKESQEYTRNLIDSSLDMIIAADQNRRILEFNQAAQRTFGYTAEEVLGKDAGMLYANAEEMSRVRQALQTNGICTQEIKNRRKDGQVFPAFLSASPIKNARGEQIGFMGVSRDITELKRAEEQALRSERLTALGQMAAALAHEINNPLQVIQGILDLVIDFPLQPRERENNLQVVRQEIGRLGQVAERILRFASPARVMCRAVAVEELLEQTLKLAGKHLQHAHIQVSTDIYLIPPVLAAPEQMVQVFLNLILNAIEEMKNGGKIEISVRAEGTMAAIGFKNNGPAIPEAVMAHIFEPFFTTKPDGSGLGLSISQQIVHQQNGKITAENLTPERGVLFTVYLPLTGPVLD